DVETATLLVREVSDGIIAPGYAPEALELLRQKRKGGYNIIQIDPGYEPPHTERREIFGLTFEQGRNDVPITRDMFQNIVTEKKDLPEAVILDMMIAQITLKYTQSNSVCYVKDGQTIGIGAGQQSRIHCTRLAGDKADHWWLRQCPEVLGLEFLADLPRPARDNMIDEYILDTLSAETKRAWLEKLDGVTVGSDAFFPFGDNIERAVRSGARYIVQPGGSIRDDHVIETCDKYSIAMAFTGLRLFHH
ncbi:MAG: phosphoribosylaminoimidazolecarboxamide formyltransferase, partial [Oscillospiraceae bacterium]|nr:phosphoribosylaminoimidazolecarboxamide formyltransferase [Oscillospiraceae bacterium]